MPFGSSLLTSGDYSDIDVNGKRVSHIKNRSKRWIKAYNCNQQDIYSNCGKVGHKKEDCRSIKKRRSVKRRSDKPYNMIHGTRDRSCWLSYGVCK
ncbi:hypothetical protein GIB67_014662 [Kingdonia uniflora]|uniref:Uncharacterized protein n=1 Tax=Kingdonia uniflora TaxID=39325 RepID=A0A7J7LY33_9MAGN|nr:hypothetical protein GIB67_014662 [Kingdonia uniflora]